MYTAELQVKCWEQDDFDRGCLPETGGEAAFPLSFSAATMIELIDKLSEFHEASGIEDMDLDALDETGRLDVQRTENDDGDILSPSEVEQWRQGKIRAWLATYTYSVLRCEVVSVVEAYMQEARNKLQGGENS